MMEVDDIKTSNGVKEIPLTLNIEHNVSERKSDKQSMQGDDVCVCWGAWVGGRLGMYGRCLFIIFAIIVI